MLFRSKNITPEAKFWNWFSKNHKRLLKLEQQEMINSVYERLIKYDDELSVVVGVSVNSDPNELIISAHGNLNKVNAVESLCDAASNIPNWKVVRFRPRFSDSGSGLVIEGNKIDITQVRFTIKPNGPKVDVQIYAHWRTPENDNNPDFAEFVLLDHTIGEYEVMCGIGFIEVHPLENAPENARPWNEFADMFDENWVRES